MKKIKIKVKPDKPTTKIIFPIFTEDSDDDNISLKSDKFQNIEENWIFEEDLKKLDEDPKVDFDVIMNYAKQWELITQLNNNKNQNYISKKDLLVDININNENLINLFQKEKFPSRKEISKVGNIKLNTARLIFRKINKKESNNNCNSSNFKDNYIKYLKTFIEIENNRFLSLRILKIKFQKSEFYKERFKSIKIARSTFNKWIRDKKYMNYSFKTVSKYYVPQKNDEGSINQRYNYSYELISNLIKGNDIIYVDETGFKLSDVSKRGWTLKGTKCKYNRWIGQTKNITFLSALNQNSVVSYIFYRKGTTSNTFYNWFLKTYQKLKFNPNKTVFVLDNLRSHHSLFYHKKLNSYFKFLFLPTYQPMMNPIEYLFSYVKRKIRMKFITTEKKLLSVIYQIMKKIDKKKISGFLNGSYKYLYKSIKKESI